MDHRSDSWTGRIEKESDWLLRLATCLVREEEHARDLVQDTCVTALSRPPRDRLHPRAWLRRVMLNHVRQAARRGSVRGPTSELPSEYRSPDSTSKELLERREVLAVLAEELAALEEPFRSTLEQHFLFERTSSEIARGLALPDGTVRWRVKRGLERLRERLDVRNQDRSVWVGALLPFVPRGPGSARVRPGAGGLRPFGVLSRGVLARLGAPAAGSLLVLSTLLFSGRDRNDPGPLAAPRPSTSAPHGSLLGARAPLAPPGARTSIPTTAPALDVAADGSFPGLAVRVVDADGRPLPGAEVAVVAGAASDVRARTDVQGRARIPYRSADLGAFGAPSTRGRLTLLATAEGQAGSCLTSVDPLRIDAREPLVLRTLGSEARIEGLVVDPGGSPVEGVQVTALLDPNFRAAPGARGEFRTPEVVSTRSAMDGSFSFAGRPRRSHLLALSHPRSKITMTLVEPDADGLLSARLLLQPGSRVVGRVTLPDGRPAADARVWFEPSLRGTEWILGTPGFDLDRHGFTQVVRTGSDGRYELWGVPAGRRRVYAQAAQEARLLSTCLLDFEGDDDQHWDVRLESAPALRARLVDSEQRPLAGWTLELRALGEDGPPWRRHLLSDEQGRLACLDAVGPCTAWVQAPGVPDVPVCTAVLEPGPEERVIVVAENRLASLTGRLIEADGGVPSGKLFLLPARNAIPIPLEFDALRGLFRSRLEPGSYSLVLSEGAEALGCWLADLELPPGVRSDLGLILAPPLADLTIRVPGWRSFGPRPCRLEACTPSGTYRVWEGEPQTRRLKVHAGLLALTAPAPGGLLQTAWIRVQAGTENVLDLEQGQGSVRVELGSLPGRVTLFARPDREASGLPGTVERRVSLWPLRTCGAHLLVLPPGDWALEARTDDPGQLGVQTRVRIDGLERSPVTAALAAR